MNEAVPIGPDSPLKRDIGETEAIVLKYSDNVLTFDFAALDFTAPEKNRYAYIMEGFNRDWVYRDADRRFVTYTNLDPGTYTFRVIGSNNHGYWNRKGVSVKVTIIPPFWRTWWFYTLAAVAFALLSSVLINFIKKYITFSLFWKKKNTSPVTCCWKKSGKGVWERFTRPRM